MKKVDLVSGWNTLWGGISSNFSGLSKVLAVIGVAIIVFSLVSHFWQRRRGGAMGGAGNLAVPLIIGALFAGPEVVIPLFLKLAEFVINVIIGLVSSF